MAGRSAARNRSALVIGWSWVRRRSSSNSDDGACMTTLAPVSVALKFGFLAVLYLFVLWVARSARRDLRRGDLALSAERGAVAQQPPPDATGFHSATSPVATDLAHRSPQLVVERAPGHESGMIYDVDGDL